MKKYSVAALGGTFDHFHKGHKTFLSFALSQASTVIIGITDDTIAKRKDYPQSIENYKQRAASVEQFTSKDNTNTVVKIVILHDMFGPTLEDKTIDCLVVSPLTETGAIHINKVRTSKQLPSLPIQVCHLELAQDKKYISSTRIREGVINREGFVYQSLLENDLILSESQRNQVKNPIGTLLKPHNLPQITSSLPIIAVGDIVSQFCYEQKIPITSFILDSKTKRKPILDPLCTLLPKNSLISCQNQPGTLSKELTSCLIQAFREHKHVFIEGEEDLAVLPSILLLPLGSFILYGQPDQGIVLITVTEEQKEWVRQLLS